MLNKPALPILNRSHPLAHGLVGAWSMSNGVGNKLKNRSMPYDGNLFAGTAQWGVSEMGRVLSLNGSTAYEIATPHPYLFGSSDDFSIVATFYVTSLAGVCHIIGIDFPTGGRDLWWLQITTSGQIRFVWGDSGGTLKDISSTAGDIVVNTWYTVIISIGTQYNFYANGKNIATGTNNASAWSTTNDELYIGAFRGSSSFFVGSIANILLYNGIALTQSDAYALYINPYQLFHETPNYTILNLSAATFATALSWTDNSSDETLFSVERSTTSASAGFAEITTTGSNVATYNDQNLNSGAYWYRVRAYNGAYSDYTNVAYLPTILAPSNLDVVVTQDA